MELLHNIDKNDGDDLSAEMDDELEPNLNSNLMIPVDESAWIKRFSEAKVGQEILNVLNDLPRGKGKNNYGCTMQRLITKGLMLIIEEKDRDEQVKAMFKKQGYSSYAKHEKDRVDKLIKEETDEKNVQILLTAILDGFDAKKKNKNSNKKRSSDDAAINEDIEDEYDNDANSSRLASRNRFNLIAFMAHAVIDDANVDDLTALNAKISSDDRKVILEFLT